MQMIAFVFIGGLLFVGGIASAAANLTGRGVSDERGLRGCLGFLLVLGLFVALWYSAPQGSDILRLLVTLVCGILYAPFVAGLFARTAVDSFAVHDAKVQQGYSIAERHEQDDNFDAAEGEYKKTISENPENVGARLRLAEMYYRAENYEKAANMFDHIRRLGGQKIDETQWCTATNRLVDICVTKLDDRKRAVKALEQLVHRYPDSDYAKFAKRRLQGLAGKG